MKKIPTLFERVFEEHRIVGITDKVYPGMEWVLQGEGVATVKLDGACCAIIGGCFYKRFDAKKGRKIPESAIPCSDPDPVTGHYPHWVPVDENAPGDKWFIVAFENAQTMRNDPMPDGTYEAVGPHFNGNKHDIPIDWLEPHGISKIEVKRTFMGIKNYLREHRIEGIVFWKDGEPQCKIKRSDFGFEW